MKILIIAGCKPTIPIEKNDRNYSQFTNYVKNEVFLEKYELTL